MMKTPSPWASSWHRLLRPQRYSHAISRCRPRPAARSCLRAQSFTTSTQTRARVAPDSNNASSPAKAALPPNMRIVPVSPSYFTAQPDYTDDLLHLEMLQRKYETLPTLPLAQAPRMTWITLQDYKRRLGEEVKASRFSRLLKVLYRMNRIHPALMPAEVRQAMGAYQRDHDPHRIIREPRPIDKFGRSVGLGRRKSSQARVWLVEGEGEVLVNGKTLTAAFGRVHDRESAVWALKATDRLDKYNVWALVQGGGTTGQAEALTLGLARALLVHEPMLKPALRRAGCITRDPRRVERKKPGKLKARKMPAWVKR
ncbi:MAG: 37S ribosomal protein S9, mitochondrial [Watsoniomyces obsoletus]|nr:MAG: 37S ribosomal protein S9, mitochondrial [Watsoniomyces obsoletus]